MAIVAVKTLNQSTYKPVVDAWNQLNIYRGQSEASPLVPVPIFATDVKNLVATIVAGEKDPVQHELAVQVKNVVESFPAHLQATFVASTPYWGQASAAIQQGLAGSIVIFNGLAPAGMTKKQTLTHYTFTPAATPKSGDTAEAPAESSFPVWVIPAVAAAVVLGGAYWYMKRA